MAFFDDINDDKPKDGQSSSNENSSYRSHSDRVKDEPPHHEDNLGEAPELPPLYFTYDPTTKKFQVRDKRGNVKDEIDIMTINGASAYHLWKDGQVEGSDTSYQAYLKDIKGKDGKNGKNAFEEWQESRDPNTDRSWEAYLNFFKGDDGQSAFDLWKAVHGEKENANPDDFFEYLKGKDGKDAYEVWQELGYKNGTRQDFFKWLASLVETQKGDDGKIFYPHFDGFTLYYTEDAEGKGPRLAEKDVRGKDGRTFTPKFDGTKLHFEDEEGTPTTETVELKGKDAFELWKEYHHKPDAKYEEFEEFFKGQNVKSDHSYLDIKDFTCPVQTIDTELIANVLDSAKSPDELIRLRQEDIDNLRIEGESLLDDNQEKKKGLQKAFLTIKKIFPLSFLFGFTTYKNWAGWFKEFSWWCAGADRPLLRMCPGDHSKYTGIGTVILFTALMAWFSSYIAMRLVFQVPEDANVFSGGANLAAFCFATFWALMIFFLDRFITNTMYSDGKVTISKDELLGGLPRILIAVFLGIIISAPLELKIFQEAIEEKIEHDRRFGGLIDKNNVTKLKKGDYEEAKNKIQTEINQNKDIIDTHQKVLEDLNNQREALYKECSVSNENESYTCQTSKSKSEQAEWDKKYKPSQDSLNAQISRLSSRNIELANQLNSKISQISKEEEHYKNLIDSASVDKGLLVRLSKLHELAMDDYVGWGWTGGEDLDKNGIIDYKEESFLGHLLHSWIVFLFFTPIGLIMLLFILIDISPVLYKMMLADGVYDNYLHQEKLLAQDKIRLSLARMLRNIEKGELKALSPFIMGKIYRKLMKFSTNSSGKHGDEEKDYKQHIEWGDMQGLNEEIKETNDNVFRIVLDYKKRIVLASYAAWYRDMRDAMIGAKDDAQGEKINPKSHFQESEGQTANDAGTSGKSTSEDAQSADQESQETDDNG